MGKTLIAVGLALSAAWIVLLGWLLFLAISGALGLTSIDQPYQAKDKARPHDQAHLQKDEQV